MDIKVDLTAIVVVSVVFLASTAIVGIVFWFLHRARELRHETIRQALEKGQPLPPELLDGGAGGAKRKDNDLQKGIKLIFVGLGLGLFFHFAFQQERLWAVGLMVGFVGLGHLVSHWVTGRKQPDASPVG